MDDITVPELRERFRLGLAGAPAHVDTLQDGVDLAERDMRSYLEHTTPQQRIEIGERAKALGLKPKHPRSMRAGRIALAGRLVEILLGEPDTAFRDAVMAQYYSEEAER